METYDVVILGAGAAGMMCGIETARRGRRTLVLDHAAAPGEKIRISGGGRCNFTNLEADRADRFLSENPRFALSALRRFRPQDFVARIEAHGIAWCEKAAGQLFCEGSAREVVQMLVSDLSAAGATLRLGAPVTAVDPQDGGGFRLSTDGGEIRTARLVVATGGKSIPKMGATGFGYDIARRFGLRVTETRPGLVPLTFEIGLLERTQALAGVAVDGAVTAGKARFAEPILFTHRGLSGPAILQASSYWREGEPVELDLAPGSDVLGALKTARRDQGRQAVATVLARTLPRRLADHLAETQGLSGPVGDVSDQRLKRLAEAVNRWRVKPVGSEGYRTAEVTLGGVDTAALDQRTLEARAVPGLYFIGEVVDVTGWLGGYNFQWAWASGWCAGQAA